MYKHKYTILLRLVKNYQLSAVNHSINMIICSRDMENLHKGSVRRKRGITETLYCQALLLGWNFIAQRRSKKSPQNPSPHYKHRLTIKRCLTVALPDIWRELPDVLSPHRNLITIGIFRDKHRRVRPVWAS